MGKLTDEQLKSIKDATGKMNSILTEVGFLEARKAEYLAAHFEAGKELDGIKAEIREEYGDITVNLADGTYEEAKQEEETKTLEIAE
jgi:hypothetical protein